MKKLILAIIGFLCFTELAAQEQYIGLNGVELTSLATMAVEQENTAETQRVALYTNFLSNLDTLYTAFSTKLSEGETSPALKRQLSSRLGALDELTYYASAYRDYQRIGNSIEAQLSLAQYYATLDKLELREYFNALKESNNDIEISSEGRPSRKPTYTSSGLSYYMGIGLNYSIVSFASVEFDPGTIEFSQSDNSIGGLSRDFYLGISYQLNPQFSGFLELGFSGQSLNNSTEILFLDPGVPEGAFTYTVTRNVQHRYTDLRLGGSYQLDKLQLQLGLQFSFLNALEMNYEFDDSFSDETTSNEYDPEEDYGFNKTRSFVMLGANYPLYAFNIAQKRASLDAFVRLSISLSSVIDKDSEQNFFNDFEKFNNNLIHLGLSLRL
jgi:hypothetical protein